MKVAVLDDYQQAVGKTAAIERLKQHTEVRVFTEKIAAEDALIRALADTKAIIPIRERTKFTASLLQKLPDLELISQTGNHAYHIDLEAATRAGIVVSLAPGGNTPLSWHLVSCWPSCVAYRKVTGRYAAANGHWYWAMCSREKPSVFWDWEKSARKSRPSVELSQ